MNHLVFFLQILTTILEEDVQTVTATEIKTSSILVTPEPTWKIETITIQPTKQQAPVLQTTAPNDAAIQEQLLRDQLLFNLPEEILRSFNLNANNNQQASSLGVKIRKLKVDFKTGGTWCRVRQ